MAWSFAQKLVVSLFILLVVTAVVAYVYGKPPQRVELRIGVLEGYPTTLFLAEQYGIGARYGIVLKLVRFRSSGELMEALDNGSINMAVLPPYMAAQRILGKGDLVVVAIDLLDDSGLMALRSLNITNVTGLEGVRIGADESSPEYKLFSYLYKELYNRSVETLNIVNTPYPQIIQAAASHEISAAIVREPYLAILQSDYNYSEVEKISTMMSKQLGTQEQIPYTLIVASSKLASEKPEGLDSFVKMHDYTATVWQERADLDEEIVMTKLNLTAAQASLLAANMPAWTKGLTDTAIKMIKDTWQTEWKAGILKQNPAKIGTQYFWA